MCADFLQGENLWSLIRAMTALEHCSLLGGIAFGVFGFLVLFWWCFVRFFKNRITVAGLFFFVILLYFIGRVHS